jgi:UDP-N-acetylglucosamine 1-carboxyvinyltransferase
MSYILIKGGPSLRGTVKISGSKNAVLPLACLGLLTDQSLVLHRVPAISDVVIMGRLLQAIGMSVVRDGSSMRLSTTCIKNAVVNAECAKKIRASVVLMGALLARHGHVDFPLPGGCGLSTTSRAIDYHLSGFQALGACIEPGNSCVRITAPKGRMDGGTYTFPQPSLTGTINVVLAAVLAKGGSALHNISVEPEVLAVIQCLQAMGAIIERDKSSLYIQGTDRLKGALYTVPCDRIEMGTYMVASAMTQGDITVIGDCIDALDSPIHLLREMGACIDRTDEETVRVRMTQRPECGHLTTGPFPLFPTDLQAPFLALMCIAKGRSTVKETIWDNRFMHVAELRKMGACIDINGNTATIVGQDHLEPNTVHATDLRTCFSLILAGLAARGQSQVHNIFHLDRGYEDAEGKLSNCGACIQRVTEGELQRSVSDQCAARYCQ